jgi:hypothetical protein
MSGLTRETRLQVMLTEDELNALDDWRFKFRLPSRASAIRELLKRGLSAEGIAVVTNAAGSGNRRSSDFGVVDGKPAATRQKRGNGAAKNT